jgi:hypothetical protein
MVDKLRLGALAACRAALRPLIRILLEHGVMHKEFIALSKEIYVDVAMRQYGLRGRPTNDSRVALLTGLDRKEVARIKKSLGQRDGTELEPPRRQDRIARVLSGWFQDQDYLDAHDTPRVLSLEGPAPSFESLVSRYGGDIPAVTIFRELKRTGAVRVDERGVEVLRRNYRLDTADPDSLVRAGSVFEDIGTTVTHNLYPSPGASSRFEARATNTEISKAALPAYREMIYGEAQAFLERVDSWLTQHEIDGSAESAGSAAPIRLGAGVYWIQSQSEET